MKIILYNLQVMIVCLLVGGIALEIFLRFDGRYADLVSENLVRTRAIWDRPVNDTQYRTHPDLNYQVKIEFNDFRIRNHLGQDSSFVDSYRGKVLGFFGDSMTENRRVDDEFTFTSIMESQLSPDFLVLNFGVDGYGLDQSYLKYLDFEHKEKLSKVFYVFVTNDFRNIYENQLFDFEGGNLVEPIEISLNPFIEAVRQLHVTYLFVDSYARLKAKAANETYTQDTLNKRIVDKFVSKEGKKEQEKRFHDEYADSLAKDFLSEKPADETLEWANNFRLLLSTWKSAVESNGASFNIIVIPTQAATGLAKKLIGEQFRDSILYLEPSFPEGYSDFRFITDDHWNEMGNLRAAKSILDWGYEKNLWQKNDKAWSDINQSTQLAIEKLYQTRK